MVDLEREADEAPAVHRGTALIYVSDEDLARIVSLLLRDAAFQVERCGSIAELESRAERVGVSVVLIAGGADTPGAHPLGGFRPRRERDYLTVALVSGEGAAARTAGADYVMPLPFDPGTFTAEILRRLPPA